MIHAAMSTPVASSSPRLQRRWATRPCGPCRNSSRSSCGTTDGWTACCGSWSWTDTARNGDSADEEGGDGKPAKKLTVQEQAELLRRMVDTVGQEGHASVVYRQALRGY